MGILKSAIIAAKSIIKKPQPQSGTFKYVLINGCDAGSVGASLALILAENAVRVFACSSNGSAMEGLEHHPNITAMVMNGISLSTIDSAPENVTTWLSGEPLKMLVNAGMVGLEIPSHYSQEEIDQRYAAHLLTAQKLPIAFQDLLVESHGTVLNFTSPGMLEHEHSITSHPSTNGGIMDVTKALRSTLVPYDVEVITIAREANGQLRSMIDDFQTWIDASALARDILLEISRLPGDDRAI